MKPEEEEVKGPSDEQEGAVASNQKSQDMTKEEFVKWHMTKFAKLEDDNFLIVTGRLLKKAEDEVVIDPPQ